MTKPIHGAPQPKNVPSDMQATAPVACEFKPGDRVIFRNEYGAQFNKTVRGFAKALHDADRFVYLDLDCWWFPVSPANLQRADGVAGTAQCPACNGYGRVNDGSGARSPYGPKCPKCGGSGRVPAGVQASGGEMFAEHPPMPPEPTK